MGLVFVLMIFTSITLPGFWEKKRSRKRFKEAFGTEIRVYKAKSDGSLNTGKGAKSAPAKSTMANICAKGQKVKDLKIKKNKSVGEIEKEFASNMGIGIQIMLPDGSGLAPDNMRLKDVAKLASK